MKKQVKLGVAVGIFLTAVVLRIVLPGSGKEESTKFTHTETITGKIAVNTINLGEYLGITEEAMPVMDDVSPAVEKAVAVFMEQQREFSDLAVPVNVTYDVHKLPFPYVSPVTAATSSGFGYRVHPLEHVTRFHYGTDLAADCGDDIVCFAEGVVVEVNEDDGYGKYIRVEHDDGYETLYAHCSVVYVSEGQYVQAGEKIALVGATGQVTGPHLHFELTQNGVYTNPEFYLADL